MFGVKKALIGFSGATDSWGSVIHWFLDDPFSNKAPKCKEIEFLMLTDKGQIFHGTNLKNWMMIPEKHFAIGSGGGFALAAMSAGKSPKKAVEIASQHDIYTGAEVLNYKI
jgi:ATP-dependent protease HslVU (ClpYQ) peptidase subunit